MTEVLEKLVTFVKQRDLSKEKKKELALELSQIFKDHEALLKKVQAFTLKLK